MRKYDLSVITVHYNNAELLIEVINKSIQSTNGLDVEFVIVDNQSDFSSYEFIRRYYATDTRIRLIRSDINGGFGYGCNLGAKYSSANYLWFLNSDAWIESVSGLSTAIELLDKSDTGLVGTSVINHDMTSSPQGGGDMSFQYLFLSSFRLGLLFRLLPIQIRTNLQKLFQNFPGHIGNYFKSYQHNQRIGHYKSLGVGGASFLVNKSVFISNNGFDEQFFLYDEDADLCKRLINNNFINYIVPTILVLSYKSATTSKLPSIKLKKIKFESRNRFINKHFDGLRRRVLLIITSLTWLLL